METHKKLEEWANKMGYDGEMPPLKEMCIPSTEFIWQQLIDKIKPRQEIELMKRNIIINRLREQEGSMLCQLDQSLIKLPIEEIEVWKKKKELQRKLKEVEKRIEEMEAEVDETSLQNKMRYITLENIRKTNEEIEQRTFLYKEKSKCLQDDILKAEEMLTLIKNLTPVEYTQPTDRENISRTLQECAKKLKEYVHKQSDNKSSVPSFSDTVSPKLSFLGPCQIYATPRNKMSSCSSTLRARSTGIFCTDKKNQYLDSLNVDGSCTLICRQQGTDNTLELPDDETLDCAIQELLTSNNRFVTYNALREMDRKLLKELMDLISGSSTFAQKPVGYNKEMHLTRLQARHVEYELRIMKSNLMSARLKREIKIQQNQNMHSLMSQFNLSNQMSQLQAILKLQQKEAGLDAALTLARKKLDQLEQMTENAEDIVFLQQKLQNLEKTINDTVDNLKRKIGIFNNNSVQMCKIRNKTCALAKQQRKFTADLNWAIPLTCNLISDEINVFSHFPLEFNRSTVSKGAKVPLKDITLTLPHEREIDSNTLRVLALVLDCPYSPPETYLLKLVREKTKTEAFKSLHYKLKERDIKIYNLEELRSKESYIMNAMTQCDSIICCESTRKTLNFHTHLEETMNLWIKMPFKDYISPSRLFKGQPYLYYDKQFSDLYKRL